MRSARIVVWAGLASVLWAAAGPAPRLRPALAQGRGGYDDAIQDHRQELEDLKRQAAEKRAKAREYARQEKGVLARLNRAEQAIAATGDYLDQLNARQIALERGMTAASAEISRAEDVLAERRKALGDRLRYGYMYGKARSLEILFSADTFAGLLERGAFLNRVLEQDRRLITEVESREAEVQDKLGRLQASKDEVDRVREEKEAERRKYESLKAERARDLGKIHDRRTENEEAARELEQAAVRMQKVLAELERKRKEAVSRNNPVLAELDHNDFGRNQGRLPWPVAGEVIDTFGRHEHAKYHTVTLNNGVDVAAPIGTPVHSVADGVVDLVQWLPGYGQTVIVNHGRGYYTIYAHLSSVAVGQGARLNPGDVLGAVGDTGSLKGPCLHFEVRQGGTAQDPQSWLR